MAGMNGFFYQALDRIPLGVAVTLEVLGPLALSVFASRRAMSVVWAALALGGVVALLAARLRPAGSGGRGLRARGGRLLGGVHPLQRAHRAQVPQADGLALAMAVAALFSLPFGLAGAGGRLLEPRTVALGVAVALMSSVLPYTLELLALRRLPAATFAVLMSLEPAIAAVAGFLVLRQALSVTDALAIALVIGASMGAVRSQTRHRDRERTGSVAPSRTKPSQK